MTDESPFACDMTAIAPEQRGAHIATIKKLFDAVRSLCCPFFDFELEIEREGGPVKLSLTGRDGVKPFIMAEIGEYLPAGTALLKIGR